MPRWLAIVGCLLFVLGGCRRDAKKVSVGIAIPSYVHAVAWIGDEGGAFQKAGVDVDVEVMGGSAATMRTLIAGQIDVGLAGGDSVLKANAAGADLVIIGGLVDRYYHRIVARDGVDDLRGKKIGLPFLGGPQDMAVKAALAELGLDYDEDVEVVSLGKEFNRMAALQSGEIDATTSQSPDSTLKELGVHVVSDLPASGKAFPYLVVVVQRSWLKDHRGEAQSVLEGLCRATRAYRDDRDGSLKIIAKHLGNADVDGAAQERYDSSGPSLISMPPEPPDASLHAVLGMLGRGDESIEGVVDRSVLQDVIARGQCQ